MSGAGMPEGTGRMVFDDCPALRFICMMARAATDKVQGMSADPYMRGGLKTAVDNQQMRGFVAGKVLDSPAFNVADPATVLVDGKPLPAAASTRLWRYHKPPGVVTTERDPEGRPTVFDRLPSGLPRVMTIGRLDIASEGLLLLTNDGALKRHLELPATGWTRRYRVRVYGRVEAEKLASLAGGITVDGMRYGAIQATLERQEGANAWIAIGLREGKNREIRRMFATQEMEVTRMIRVEIGAVKLG